MEDLGSDTIKLEGYGVYVTCINKEPQVCLIDPGTGGPTKDRDGCMEYTELTDPPNQKFLNIINAKFSLCLTMQDFGEYMSLREIRDHIKNKDHTARAKELSSSVNLIWQVKNLREKHK